MHRFLRHTITVCHKNKSNKAKQKCFPIVNPVAQMIYRHVFSMSTTEVANALKDEVHTQVDQRFRACINQVIDKKMRPDQFLRALMEHETWYLPVNKETDTFQNRFRDENNKLYYFYYSDLQAMITGDNYFMYKNVTEKFPEERYFLTLPGFKAFGSIDDEADIISINPHSPPFEVHYKKHQIALLKQWAQTVQIEYLIRTLDDNNLQELFKPMSTYEHFWIVLNKRPQGEDYDIVLAPDVENRYLIAIFTAEDLVDDFLTRRVQEFGQKSMDNDIKYKVSGKELFPQLAAMRPEGIVFNCFREARAFNYSFIEFVMSRD